MEKVHRHSLEKSQKAIIFFSPGTAKLKNTRIEFVRFLSLQNDDA